jgi:hypothetical protein
MAQIRFTCTLTKTDESTCQSYARVTIVDTEEASGPRVSSARRGGP